MPYLFPPFVELRVFAAHQFLVTACTIVGCTNSSQVTLFTAQLPPAHVDAPVLTVLDSKTIYAQLSIDFPLSPVVSVWDKLGFFSFGLQECSTCMWQQGTPRLSLPSWGKSRLGS